MSRFNLLIASSLSKKRPPSLGSYSGSVVAILLKLAHERRKAQGPGSFVQAVAGTG